jgi:hypothetical protein
MLVVVCDDFIYEPITALVHPISVLLTESSFAKDAIGSPLTFPNVDAGSVTCSISSVLQVMFSHQSGRTHSTLATISTERLKQSALAPSPQPRPALELRALEQL